MSTVNNENQVVKEKTTDAKGLPELKIVEQDPIEHKMIPNDSISLDEIENTQSDYDKALQKMIDAFQSAWNLDPKGESRAVLICTTTSNGKVTQVMADSTPEQRFQGMELYSLAYVEAEVLKTKTAFQDKQKNVPDTPIDGDNPKRAQRRASRSTKTKD